MSEELFGHSDEAGSHIQDKLPEHIEPPRREFLPWHRVHKEFIRKHQWSRLTIRLIERRYKSLVATSGLDDQKHTEKTTTPEGKSTEPSAPIPLKCLFIPGDDLLDVRALYRDLTPLGCHLQYLGFNESGGSNQAGTKVHIANNAVTSQQRVLKDSFVAPDRFEKIANDNSQALNHLRRYGPYHIVNLDFCGSLLPCTGASDKGYLNAVHKLLSYQFKNHNSYWLLFISTEVQPEEISLEGLDKLCTATRRNFHTYEEFAEKTSELLPPEAFVNSAKAIDFKALNSDHLIRLFGVGFGKWLIDLCHSASPKWTVRMRRSYQYTISNDHKSVMLALAFEFHPNLIPPQDPSGLSSLKHEVPEYLNELQSGMKILESVSNIKDADAEISRLGEFSELRDAQADLLAMAGYDRNAYIEWVQDGEGRKQPENAAK